MDRYVRRGDGFADGEPGSLGLPVALDLMGAESDAQLREENDARELAIYGLALPHMRFLRTSGWSVWLVPETAEWPEEHGTERVFMVGDTPLFESEMVAKAMGESDKLEVPDFLVRYKQEGRV
jgi:hypothetical protein